MDLNIEWAEETAKLPTFHLVFASCSQQQEAEQVSIAKDVRVSEQVEHTEAVVMLLGIVEFTKACSEFSAVEVSVSTAKSPAYFWGSRELSQQFISPFHPLHLVHGTASNALCSKIRTAQTDIKSRAP